jgi:hypothetical protein
VVTDETAQRWAARPVQAAVIRGFLFVVPIVGSVIFLHFLSGLVAMPTSSFVLFISWWVLMSGAATVVLVVIERITRRLLPLVALYKLSLVFPDAAPSRFRNALRSNTVETLAERVAHAKALNDGSTPVEAAERLLALVSELDSHDRLTRGHSDRVRAYAQMIGKEMHLSSSQLDLLNWAALLHDVGKLNVPSEILTKVGHPTDEEWNVLRRHPELGQELIAPLREWLGEWSHAVIQHHERWDGNGYPHGISGGDISLAARIVAVADVFDVITSARSYKSSFASTVARDEIARCAGEQLDPRVVRAFLNISLGRLRLVMGPLSWLAHVPVLGRLPFTPAIGAVSASVAAMAAVVTTGLVGTPPSQGLASTGLGIARGVARPIERVTHEDQNVVVSIDRVGAGATVISLRVIGQPSVGRVRTTTGHEILYSPPPDFSGDVSVEYEACWADRGCRRGIIRISVVPVNDAPMVRDDRATTRRGVPVSIDVLANDSDAEGDPLSIVAVSDLDVGGARIVARRIRWSPPPAFVGTTSFRYTATDGLGGRAGARVTVRVRQTASAPPPTKTASTPPPVTPSQPESPVESASPPPAEPGSPSPADKTPNARIDKFSVPEGGAVLVDVLANDSDPDGEALSIVSVGSPARGTVRKVGDRVQFTAPSDYVGEVTFPYTITDPQGARDSSSVAVSVLLVNVPPSFSAGGDQSVLEDAGAQTVPGWAGSIYPGAASEADQVVSFLTSNDNSSLFATQPGVGSDGTLTYESAANASGSASVTVRATDDGGIANGGADTSAPKTFTITVKPANDPPTANPDGVTVNEDDPAGVTFNVLSNDTDVDTGDSLSVSSYNDSTIANGALTDNGGGSFTFVPDSGFDGTETFTYVTADGSAATSSATVTITVTPVQHAPVAGNDAYTTPQGTPLSIAAPGVLGNDGDSDGNAITLQTSLISGPTNGTVTLAADGSFVYTPGGGFSGTDSFTYRIEDGTGRVADGTATLTVTTAAALPSTFYFQGAGPSANIWNMTPALPPAQSQLFDFDGDGKPGLTIKNSDGKESVKEAARYQIWTFTPPGPLVLNGPVAVDLWSSTGVFGQVKPGTLYAYLYDCTPGGTVDPFWSGCTRIASNAVFSSPWNASLIDWGYRSITVGSVSRTIPAGNELRVRLLFHPSDLWLTMSAAYPTALVVTLG